MSKASGREGQSDHEHVCELTAISSTARPHFTRAMQRGRTTGGDDGFGRRKRRRTDNSPAPDRLTIRPHHKPAGTALP